MNRHNYEGTRFKKLKDKNKGVEGKKLYEAAGNLRISIVRKCHTSGTYESEEQPLRNY